MGFILAFPHTLKLIIKPIYFPLISIIIHIIVINP